MLVHFGANNTILILYRRPCKWLIIIIFNQSKSIVISYLLFGCNQMCFLNTNLISQHLHHYHQYNPLMPPASSEMVEGSQRRFSQIWFFSTPTNPERTRLKHLNVLWKSIFLIPQLPSLCSCGLVVDGTVDCKDNKEKRTREVADIMMYHFSWNVLQLGCDMLWCGWST